MTLIRGLTVGHRADDHQKMENGAGSASSVLASNFILDKDSNNCHSNKGRPPADLLKRLEEVGQAHLLSYWSQLDALEQTALLSDIQDVDFRRLGLIFNQSTSHGNDFEVKETLFPVQNVVTLEGRRADDVQRRRELGLRAIASGELAVLLLAGGQGTRLGSLQPKGCYGIGLPSRKSLFHLQAGRILRVQKMAATFSGQGQVKILWLIMTSEFTHATTVSYFQRSDYFGLDPDQVRFFSQGTLPCMDENGKVILEKPYKIARAPDGNGGVYAALKTSGCLSEMEMQGVRYVECYCVDNALVRVADPVYLGLSIERRAVCSSKVVKKVRPEERVGVFAEKGVGGPTVVIEYSELDKSLACSVDPQTGRLLFNWSNICIHLYSLDFLKKLSIIFEEQARFHVARKTIPCIDGGIFGVKLERFIFDAFVYAPCLTLLEVEREEEFSPVKNPVGSATESPEIACRNLLKMHGRWVIAAGGRLEWGDKGNGDSEGWGVEVDPLLSHAGEDLEVICQGQVFKHLSEVHGDSR